MDHIAREIGKDPLEIRQLNLYKKGESTPLGHSLPYFDLDTVVNKLKESSNYLERKKDVVEFNKLNRFKKRGISLLPIRYSLNYNLGYYNALVTIRYATLVLRKNNTSSPLSKIWRIIFFQIYNGISFEVNFLTRASFSQFFMILGWFLNPF